MQFNLNRMSSEIKKQPGFDLNVGKKCFYKTLRTEWSITMWSGLFQSWIFSPKVLRQTNPYWMPEMSEGISYYSSRTTFFCDITRHDAASLAEVQILAPGWGQGEAELKESWSVLLCYHVSMNPFCSTKMGMCLFFWTCTHCSGWLHFICTGCSFRQI